MGSGGIPSLLPPGRRRAEKSPRVNHARGAQNHTTLTDYLRELPGLVSRHETVLLAIKPIERLVPVSSTHYCAYTPGLSTWSSTTALKGELVSRWVSRLDAFSGYPVRTWLSGGATGVTTGAPEVCPSRSSRTRDSASQVSFTHGR